MSEPHIVLISLLKNCTLCRANSTVSMLSSQCAVVCRILDGQVQSIRSNHTVTLSCDTFPCEKVIIIKLFVAVVTPLTAMLLPRFVLQTSRCAPQDVVFQSWSLFRCRLCGTMCCDFSSLCAHYAAVHPQMTRREQSVVALDQPTSRHDQQTVGCDRRAMWHA